ncbi:hypothetical protein BSIN_3626 [Burkholderia singularis]|uniref:Uncharacterized protein n=1 Tax=Burkholderia singularis TaxID=1503053 RepID=A0A238H5E8_9BURK|nr:hypothetical protein BSIN_3626 [Burkholderia singularis]
MGFAAIPHQFRRDAHRMPAERGQRRRAGVWVLRLLMSSARGVHFEQ